MNLRNRLLWVTAIAGLAVDQLTKFIVVQNFELMDSLPLLPGVFHLTFVTNKGAAFSLFSESGEWLRWLSLAVSAGLVALAVFVNGLNRWEQYGYGFILAGALGNGIDRFMAGEVVDFLDFRLINFPIFNFADVFINVGIVCLLIATFRRPAPTNGNGRNK
ncbi:signal peptidase II [Leptolyngbya sp. AN02str]|uniref:signal peptidase II n=1 Tax=Leptolyngbya sp. AN02str TaxID=3423363 RepID=UPI003D3174EF